MIIDSDTWVGITSNANNKPILVKLVMIEIVSVYMTIMASIVILIAVAGVNKKCNHS